MFDLDLSVKRGDILEALTVAAPHDWSFPTEKWFVLQEGDTSPLNIIVAAIIAIIVVIVVVVVVIVIIALIIIIIMIPHLVNFSSRFLTIISSSRILSSFSLPPPGDLRREQCTSHGLCADQISLGHTSMCADVG